MNTDEMEMPCLCEKCSKWFDLNDGVTSDKWYPDTVICEDCGSEEQKEIERDEEIQELKDQIEDAEYILKSCKARLAELEPETKPSNLSTPEPMYSREQILNAFEAGSKRGTGEIPFNAEQYYNQTFGAQGEVKEQNNTTDKKVN